MFYLLLYYNLYCTGLRNIMFRSIELFFIVYIICTNKYGLCLRPQILGVSKFLLKVNYALVFLYKN